MAIISNRMHRPSRAAVPGGYRDDEGYDARGFRPIGAPIYGNQRRGRSLSTGRERSTVQRPNDAALMSEDFDPTDPANRTRSGTESSANFRRSVLKNNALKAMQAAQGAQRAAERNARRSAPSPAVVSGGQSAGVAAPIDPHSANPYASTSPGQNPGRGRAPDVSRMSGGALGAYRKSGLEPQEYADRGMAMDRGQGRIRAVLPADMAANYEKDVKSGWADKRDDQVTRGDGTSIQRFVKAAPQESPQELAARQQDSASRQTLNADLNLDAAAVPNLQDRQMQQATTELVGAQTDAVRQGAADGMDYRKAYQDLLVKFKQLEGKGGGGLQGDVNAAVGGGQQPPQPAVPTTATANPPLYDGSPNPTVDYDPRTGDYRNRAD